MANVTQAGAEKWAMGFLSYLKAPAASVNDPRVRFLAAQYHHEGVGGTNPLAITLSEGQPSTNLAGNSAGVKLFNSVSSGYKALSDFFTNQGITGYLGELKNPGTTVDALTQALAGAGWEGSANTKAKAASVSYANAVGQAAGATQMVPVPTVSMTPAPVEASLASSPVNSSTTIEATPPSLTGGPPQTPGSTSYDARWAPAPAQTASQLGTAQAAAMSQQVQDSLLKPYTGPNAYKGFDLSGIPNSPLPGAVGNSPTTILGEVKRGIDIALSTPGGIQGIMTNIAQAYGSEAWMAAQPELRTLLVAGTMMGWEKDPALFQSLVENTSWWKTTTDNMRNYQQTMANDPGQITGPNGAMAQAQARIVSVANTLGVQLNAAQLAKITNSVVMNSVSQTGTFSNTAMTDQMINEAVAQEFNATTFAQSVAGQQTPIAAMGANAPYTAINPGGDAATLMNQFQQIARNYYLNLTPQQIAQHVQDYLRADTGQGNLVQGAVAGFTSFAQNQAKMLYPAFASALGTTSSLGNDQNLYNATASYRNLISQFTGNANADSIDLRSPQWSWILTGAAPPSSTDAIKSASGAAPNNQIGAQGTSAPPAIDVVQRYLMQQPAFQSTDLAKNMGWQLGSAIVKAFGYN